MLLELANISECICENITYDFYEIGYGEYGAHIDDYGNVFEREQKPEDLLDNRIGVCEGYARLTKALCNAVGIQAAKKNMRNTIRNTWIGISRKR